MSGNDPTASDDCEVRLEAREGLRALLDRFEHVDADLDGLEPAASALYGLRSLPVELA